MGIPVRPTKAGGTGDYTAGTDILADEANADILVLYALLSGQLDATNFTANPALPGTYIAAAPLGIPTDRINDLQVTTAKLADAPNGVTASKINTDAVILSKIKKVDATVAFGGDLAVNGGRQYAGSTFTPALPSIANMIPLNAWVVRTSSPPQRVFVGFSVDNTGAVFVNVVNNDSALVTGAQYTIHFLYVPVS